MLIGRFGRVIIVPKDNNTNMLRSEVWKELRQLDELVQNITVKLPTGETFTYKEECARWEGQCFTNDILNLDHIIGEVSLKDTLCPPVDPPKRLTNAGYPESNWYYVIYYTIH